MRFEVVQQGSIYDEARSRHWKTVFFHLRGEMIGAVRHIEEPNLRRVELLSEEAVKASEIEGEPAHPNSFRTASRTYLLAPGWRPAIDTTTTPCILL